MFCVLLLHLLICCCLCGLFACSVLPGHHKNEQPEVDMCVFAQLVNYTGRMEKILESSRRILHPFFFFVSLHTEHAAPLYLLGIQAKANRVQNRTRTEYNDKVQSRLKDWHKCGKISGTNTILDNTVVIFDSRLGKYAQGLRETD